ncbi:hypothetical protein MAMMFC1_03447 [Methylomusa anaerophila]|uniref:Uncharacterized protein n=1 Tax=Methylomusa anaerophila TaxID=1930071 RepID=A0A348ANV3_9FIRM|nr:hypothetical protein MAMMFC1_03447 [Methylomusa anaerophila]
MDYKNLYVIITLKDQPGQFPVEGWRLNPKSMHKELLITLFEQKIWVDSHQVRLRRGAGTTFCWNEYNQGEYVTLNDQNVVCPECGWWICHKCGSCRCNKPQK